MPAGLGRPHRLVLPRVTRDSPAAPTSPRPSSRQTGLPACEPRRARRHHPQRERGSRWPHVSGSPPLRPLCPPWSEGSKSVLQDKARCIVGVHEAPGRRRKLTLTRSGHGRKTRRGRRSWLLREEPGRLQTFVRRITPVSLSY